MGVESDVHELIDAGERVISVFTYRGRGRFSGVETGWMQMAGVWTCEGNKIVRVTWRRTRGQALEVAGFRTSLDPMPGPLSLAAGARRIPWKTVLIVARMAYQRGSAAWMALTPYEREHLRDLAAKSKGRPSNLDVHERRRLRELAAKAMRAAREG